MRNIAYTVTQTGMTPTDPQFAGVAGEHHATAVTFTLPLAWLQEAYRVRCEFVDGAGAFDTTEFLTVTGGAVTVPLPLSWTAAGGLAEIRLAAATVEEGLPERVVAYSAVGYLYFESRNGVPDNLREFPNRGLSALIADCRAAEGGVNEAVQDLIAARDRGDFDGVSCTHEWDGTNLTVTSASGSSTADLKGDKGDTGEQGETGPVGPAGPKGDTGTGAIEKDTIYESATGIPVGQFITGIMQDIDAYDTFEITIKESVQGYGTSTILATKEHGGDAIYMNGINVLASSGGKIICSTANLRATKTDGETTVSVTGCQYNEIVSGAPMGTASAKVTKIVGTRFVEGTATSDIAWTPTVDESGNLTWLRSSTETPPTPQNIKGAKGDTGEDGFSPYASVNKSGNATTITILDKSGYTSAVVYDNSPKVATADAEDLPNVFIPADTTVCVTDKPTELNVTMYPPIEGQDFLCGLIFEAGAGFAFSDTAPDGCAIYWEEEPTWTEGTVYEIIYRCLWLDDKDGNTIISAKYAEVTGASA